MEGLSIDSDLLQKIELKKELEQDLSSNYKERELELKAIMNMINESVRRFEFNVLLALCEAQYIPYQKITVDELTSKENKKYKQLSVPYEEVKTDMALNSEIYLETLYYKSCGNLILLELKDYFKSFDNSFMLESDKLYKKLFGLIIKPEIKTLYYFLYKYPYYNFTDILQKYTDICFDIKIIDNHLAKQGLHRCVLPLTQLV